MIYKVDVSKRSHEGDTTTVSPGARWLGGGRGGWLFRGRHRDADGGRDGHVDSDRDGPIDRDSNGHVDTDRRRRRRDPAIDGGPAMGFVDPGGAGGRRRVRTVH